MTSPDHLDLGRPPWWDLLDYSTEPPTLPGKLTYDFVGLLYDNAAAGSFPFFVISDDQVVRVDRVNYGHPTFTRIL